LTIFSNIDESSCVANPNTKLQIELTKDKFDHEKIKSLKKALNGYVSINDIRGKHTTAKGVNEWFGWIEYLRQTPNETAVLNTASMLIDGNDRRGIDVSIMSRYPISWIRSHINDKMTYFGKERKTFSRDCLEAQITLPSRETLHLLVNHLKSMGYNSGRDKLGNVLRLGQTERIVEIVSEHHLDTELLAVVGDLNAPADNRSLKPLLEKDGLYNVNLELNPDKRYTYRTGKKQLDYIVVSEALKQRLVNVHIERRGVFTTTNKWEPYDTVKSRKTEASDHAVVVADFTI
jgi:endonuclease/exonuclease/phosphatase family metal-dependent hydrolase